MKYHDKNQDSDWAKEVPDVRFRGPYEDYGWEQDTSTLPEFRDEGVHLTRQERERRARKIREAGWPPRQRGRMHTSGETRRYSNARDWTDDRSEFGSYSQYYPYYGAPSEGNYRGGREAWMERGPYTGRGPQGYRRSDERIFEDVCQRLSDHGQIDARNIRVDVNNGEVNLNGVVDSRRTKRMVEDTIENISGVQDVHNNLTVQRENQMNRER